jgi:hypothetical protein
MPRSSGNPPNLFGMKLLGEFPKPESFGDRLRNGMNQLARDMTAMYGGKPKVSRAKPKPYNISLPTVNRVVREPKRLGGKPTRRKGPQTVRRPAFEYPESRAGR